MRHLYTGDFTLPPLEKVALIQLSKHRYLILDSLRYPAWPSVVAPGELSSPAHPVSAARGDLSYSRASQMPTDY